MIRPFNFKAPIKSLARLGKLSKAVGTILNGLTAASKAFAPAPSRSASLSLPKAPKRKAGTAPKRKAALPKKRQPSRKAESKPKRQSPQKFTEDHFSSAHGSRDYKLYVPSAARTRLSPLVVMLHGCTQSPDDFAAGTQMNRLADKFGFLVAYPAQPSSANASKCWNWFNATDQKRSAGEPALIAGITRQVIQNNKIDPRRVYIAGLSAGGAAAAIMAEAYPDIFAAVGVHSGVACGAARDMVSAYRAMSKGAVSAPRGKRSPVGLPLIVFQGDNDRTVHPSNADVIIARRGVEDGVQVVQQTGTAGDVQFTRTNYVDPRGKSVMENWRVHKGGHAWFGGSAAGSYATPDGPNASREMVRFFLSHSR